MSNNLHNEITLSISVMKMVILTNEIQRAALPNLPEHYRKTNKYEVK